MKLTTLKDNFTSRLSSVYPRKEIESFFLLLIEHKLNFKRIDVLLNPTIEVSKEHQIYFKDAIEKLLKEIPIQYIIGKTEFYGLTFTVSPDVLIPRPETEELVNWIIKDAIKIKKKTIKILDIGTGSGCIAISLGKHIKNAKIYALDISNESLKIAKNNATLNKVSIEFKNENILTLKSLDHKFDIIVSNPPYVRELEKNEIQKNVLEHEPHLALFVKDNNPLLFYDAISSFAKINLTKNGFLFFEINQYLGSETCDLLKQKKFNHIELRKDLNNNDRMIKTIL